MTSLRGGLIGGLLGFSVVALAQMADVLAPDPVTQSHPSHCLRVYVGDALLTEVGAQITYGLASRELRLRPCVLFADSFER